MEERAQSVIIVAAATDRLLKNGGIAGDAADAVLLNKALKVTTRKKTASYVIKPNRLTLFRQAEKRLIVLLPRTSGAAFTASATQISCIVHRIQGTRIANQPHAREEAEHGHSWSF
jgi:hypothetical protein